MPRQPSVNFDITERLIHLELADLACHRVYLDPKWPDVNEPPVPANAVRPKAAVACVDCGKKHREIFEFTRWPEGKYAGKEWEELVLPVIQRWAKFVERHLPDREEQLEIQSFFVFPRIFIFCLCVYVFYRTVK